MLLFFVMHLHNKNLLIQVYLDSTHSLYVYVWNVVMGRQ